MSLMRVCNLGKSYPVYRSEWRRVARWFGFPFKPIGEHWILRDINFEIAPGESIGIVGQNGAGKSTLLKMITGTLNPSEGEITVNGRISAILELGMGFNQELTGRQNAYYAAGLMGFSKEEVNELMPHIEAFAEIGDYFDAPMRTYSSGMQVRVAFAVATAKRPEILIVDEALAVGDAYFQHKSFQRIRDFQAQGTTLLIVSHDRSAIQALCNRAILLDKGAIALDGRPEEIFDYYNALIAAREQTTISRNPASNGKTQTVSGTGEAKIVDVQLYNQDGQLTDCLKVGELAELKVNVRVIEDIDTLVLGYGFKDKLGQVLFGTNTWHTNQILENCTSGQQIEFTLRFRANFGVGTYSLQLALVDSSTHLSKNYEWRDMALMFEVINTNKFYFVGNSWLEVEFLIKKIHQLEDNLLELT